MYDQQLCNKLRKRVFEQLTNNRGNNTSPCLLENGDVIFCSDFETGFPQIYYREASTKLTHRLTNGRGYCAAPSYNAKNNSVVYCRFVKGAFQLFMIDLGDKKRREKQLTFDFSDKQEPAWSPCGKYIVFSCDQYDPAVRHRVPQIAILNMLSRRIHVMTTGSEPKSFPHWTTQVCYK
jgi:Tol biopolymer transport system component